MTHNTATNASNDNDEDEDRTGEYTDRCSGEGTIVVVTSGFLSSTTVWRKLLGGDTTMLRTVSKSLFLGVCVRCFCSSCSCSFSHSCCRCSCCCRCCSCSSSSSASPSCSFGYGRDGGSLCGVTPCRRSLADKTWRHLEFPATSGRSKIQIVQNQDRCVNASITL